MHACSVSSLALRESADICDVAQLSNFIRGSDDNFDILEEINGLDSLHGRKGMSDVFVEVMSCLESQKLNLQNSYASVLMVELLEL